MVLHQPADSLFSIPQFLSVVPHPMQPLQLPAFYTKHRVLSKYTLQMRAMTPFTINLWPYKTLVVQSEPRPRDVTEVYGLQRMKHGVFHLLLIILICGAPVVQPQVLSIIR